MSGIAFADGNRFAEMFATAAPAADGTVPLSVAMQVVLMLVGLYFLVAIIEMGLSAKEDVLLIKERLMNMTKKKEKATEAGQNLIDGEKKEEGFLDKMTKELGSMNDALEKSVKEVPMIAILVFFTHVRVRNDLGYAIGQPYPEAIETCYWIVSAAIFVKATFAILTSCAKLCMMGWELGMNCIDVTKIVLGFLAEIGVGAGVVYLIVLIVTTPKSTA